MSTRRTRGQKPENDTEEEMKTGAMKTGGLKQKYFESKVFFIDAKLTADKSDNVEILTLRNPGSEKSAKYVYAKDTAKFYEVLSFNEEHRCWFADGHVYPNGNIFITSAFDPLFLGLYYMRLNNDDMCQPMDQAMYDKDFPHTSIVADILDVDQLSMIGDRKGDVSLKAFKYNESKAMTWLSLKCQKLADALKKSGFHIGAKSMNYVKSEKLEDENQHDGEFLSYAFGILSEYLTIDLCEKLSQRLGLEKAQSTQPGNKRKSLVELEHKTLKRVKSVEDFSSGDAEPIARPLALIPEKKLSAKEVKMAKAASGSKSISSFFTKK